MTIAPVGAAYLPYEPKFKRHQELPTFFARDPKKLLIVSNGIVQPNKHIKDLADVLKKNDDLRNAVQYVVIGDCSGPYGDELKEMASGSLSGCLFMMGYQPYDVMESFLQSADLCVNMRYPNSEVCSLSLFEQMGYGKAVIAFNSGIFGEMPEDSIIKLDSESCGGFTNKHAAQHSPKQRANCAYWRESQKIYCRKLQYRFIL